MSLETKKRVERIPPIRSIDSYEKISPEAPASGRVPEFALQLHHELSVPGETVRSEEVLCVTQDDGMEEYLFCDVTQNKEADRPYDCYGVMVDVLGDHSVGETSFFGSLGDPKHPIQVARTFTHEDLRGVGLGYRRLVTINEYCQKRFGASLYSSHNPSSAATAVWDKLMQKGLVEVVKMPHGYKHYRFIRSV